MLVNNQRDASAEGLQDLLKKPEEVTAPVPKEESKKSLSESLKLPSAEMPTTSDVQPSIESQKEDSSLSSMLNKPAQLDFTKFNQLQDQFGRSLKNQQDKAASRDVLGMLTTARADATKQAQQSPQYQAYADTLKEIKQQVLDNKQQGLDAENKMGWMQALETIGQALTQYAAARYGAEHNVNLAGLKMEKTDWDKMLERTHNRLRQELENLNDFRKETSKNQQQLVSQAQEMADTGVKADIDAEKEAGRLELEGLKEQMGAEQNKQQLSFAQQKEANDQQYKQQELKRKTDAQSMKDTLNLKRYELDKFKATANVAQKNAAIQIDADLAASLIEYRDALESNDLQRIALARDIYNSNVKKADALIAQGQQKIDETKRHNVVTERQGQQKIDNQDKQFAENLLFKEKNLAVSSEEKQKDRDARAQENELNRQNRKDIANINQSAKAMRGAKTPAVQKSAGLSYLKGQMSALDQQGKALATVSVILDNVDAGAIDYDQGSKLLTQKLGEAGFDGQIITKAAGLFGLGTEVDTDALRNKVSGMLKQVSTKKDYWGKLQTGLIAANTPAQVQSIADQIAGNPNVTSVTVDPSQVKEGYVVVRRKSTGETVQIPEANFDPLKHEKVE